MTKISDDKTEFLLVSSPYSKFTKDIQISIGQHNDIATRGVGRISLPITKQSSPLGNASPGMNFLQVFISFT